MKRFVTKSQAIGSALTVVVALSLALPIRSVLAQTDPSPTVSDQTMTDQDHSKMEMHGKMMEEHSRMMADLTAKDAELKVLVAKMNSATRDKKVDLLADIVTKVVAQQTALHKSMGEMSKMMEECEMPMNGSKGMMGDPRMKGQQETPNPPDEFK